MTKPTPLVAGNWKMNGLTSSQSEFEALETLIKDSKQANCEVLVCPPATLIASFAASANGTVKVGAQDCHFKDSGAHTGNISASMLKDIKCEYIIVGHSERRTEHSETSDLVHAKATAVHNQGLKAIICVGETEEERDAGKKEDVVLGQLIVSVPESATSENTSIGYEPIWAIGTGKTPTADDISKMHSCIRAALIERFGEDGALFRIIYGGSVKASNAVELMSAENVDGALVGGASLKATDFNGIVEAYR